MNVVGHADQGPREGRFQVDLRLVPRGEAEESRGEEAARGTV